MEGDAAVWDRLQGRDRAVRSAQGHHPARPLLSIHLPVGRPACLPACLQISAADPVLCKGISTRQLRVVSSGSGLPVIDLSRVRPVFPLAGLAAMGQGCSGLPLPASVRHCPALGRPSCTCRSALSWRRRRQGQTWWCWRAWGGQLRPTCTRASGAHAGTCWLLGRRPAGTFLRPALRLPSHRITRTPSLPCLPAALSAQLRCHQRRHGQAPRGGGSPGGPPVRLRGAVPPGALRARCPACARTV